MKEWRDCFSLKFITNEKVNLKNGLWVGGQNIDGPIQKEMYNHFTH